MLGLFKEIYTQRCNDGGFDFEWNNQLKSTSASELNTNYTAQKANTSLALGNNNISKYSNNADANNGNSDNSGLNLDVELNREYNNLSIFNDEM